MDWRVQGDLDQDSTPRMAKPFPLHPKHPERICWGCDRYCPNDALACGNGSGRTMHPIETQGEDWYLAWGIEPEPERPKQARLPASTGRTSRS
jgi:hypothetical protein